MTIGNEQLCVLTDSLRPVPFRTGGEVFPIHSVEQLVDALRNFTHRKPRVLIVDTPKGRPQLAIGMSGALGAVDLYPFLSSGRSWFAKPQTPYSSEDFWITSEGEPTWHPAWAMMPVADVIQLVAHIVGHNELPAGVEWVNLKGQRLRSLHEDIGTPLDPRLMQPPP